MPVIIAPSGHDGLSITLMAPPLIRLAFAGLKWRETLLISMFA